MKKILVTILSVLMILAFAGCEDDTPNYAKVRVDLTKLNSTMVYSEVYNMVNEPQKYVGKTVRMKGTFQVYEGAERNYYACIISDATACCQSGIEFVLAGDHEYPNDYPAIGSTITVSGVFDTYKEGDTLYCQLSDAVLGK